MELIIGKEYYFGFAQIQRGFWEGFDEDGIWGYFMPTNDIGGWREPDGRIRYNADYILTGLAAMDDYTGLKIRPVENATQ
jgi:hypothetical protein